MWEKCEEERINKIERKARSGNTTGIIGTVAGGLALLGGGNLLNTWLGGGRNYEQHEINHLAEKECSDYIELTKAWYEGRIEALNDKYAVRQNDIAEKFSLYQNDNANTKALQAQIDELNARLVQMFKRNGYSEEFANERKLSIYQLVTVASMIEKINKVTH